MQWKQWHVCLVLTPPSEHWLRLARRTSLQCVQVRHVLHLAEQGVEVRLLDIDSVIFASVERQLECRI